MSVQRVAIGPRHTTQVEVADSVAMNQISHALQRERLSQPPPNVWRDGHDVRGN